MATDDGERRRKEVGSAIRQRKEKVGTEMKLPLMLILLVGCAGGTPTPSFLNPDPVHGGPCKDGDQEGLRCSSAFFAGVEWCCHSGMTCGNGRNECIMPDAPVFLKKGDGGK